MRSNLRVILEDKLEAEEIDALYRSYDIIGDIAVLRVPETLEGKARFMAEAVMQTHRRVETVLRQTSPVSREYRLRDLEWVAGKRKTETVHKEYGCLFKVNLEKCYFSSRLSHERMRIAHQVRPGEIVVNMFAGVGCFSIIMAKHSEVKRIFSIDINPDAVQYMQENTALNKVEDKVVVVQGDARDEIEEGLQRVADRVLMPLPEKANEYLDCALSALKPQGGWVHYYDFEHANKNEDPVTKTVAKVTQKLRGVGVRFQVPFGRIVRTTGPRWYQTVVDAKILP
jgi:tRNA (guanine37-N1)-methyltransferase